MTLRVGWHRLIARDGTICGMLVADGGQIVELIAITKTDPPRRPSRRFIGTVEQVAARAERRRLEEIARYYER